MCKIPYMLHHVCYTVYGNSITACRLPERIRPTVLAFGGVADGFVPFDVPPPTDSHQASSSDNQDSTEHLADGNISTDDGNPPTDSSGVSHGNQQAVSQVTDSNRLTNDVNGASVSGASNSIRPPAGSQDAGSRQSGGEEVELQLASIVMKAVQVCMSVWFSLHGLYTAILP